MEHIQIQFSLSLCLNLSPALFLLPPIDTQPTMMPSESPTESPTVTSTTVPFYREAAFIVGMVILGVVLMFTACAIFLCCVRPRGNAGYKVTEPYALETTLLTTPLTTPTRSGLKHAKPEQEHATVTWTPGDPTWVSTQSFLQQLLLCKDRKMNMRSSQDLNLGLLNVGQMFLPYEPLELWEWSRG